MHNRTIQRRKATKYKWQKIQREQGFSPEECWNLDCTIIQFVLPRLKYFAKHTISYPARYSYDTYIKMLNEIVYGFELYLENKYWYVDNPKREEQMQAVDKAFKQFADLFCDLWD